ncbi:cytochrome c oxidase subunit II [soil metagenome]
MGRARSGRAARLAALGGLLTVALTGCSTEEVLRFGWPQGVTDEAEIMRELWTGSTIAALVVGVVVWALILWTCVFHRKRDEELPRQTAYNLPLEVVYTVVPFIIIGVLFYYTVVVQNDVLDQTDDPDVTVAVTGFQWNWEFSYPEVDDAETGSPVSILGDTDQIPVLVLPVDQTIRFEVESNDVIHSFWVPEFLFKLDLLPGDNFGEDNEFEVTIREEGAYVGRCAELCGTYHAQMNFEVRAVSAGEYDAYIAAREQGMDNVAALESIGQPGLAQTTQPFDTDRDRRSASDE